MFANAFESITYYGPLLYKVIYVFPIIIFLWIENTRLPFLNKSEKECFLGSQLSSTKNWRPATNMLSLLILNFNMG